MYLPLSISNHEFIASLISSKSTPPPLTLSILKQIPKKEQDRTLPKLFSEATNTLKEKSDKDITRIKANF